jgi:hypothetical protein
MTDASGRAAEKTRAPLARAKWNGFEQLAAASDRERRRNARGAWGRSRRVVQVFENRIG